MRKTKPNKDRDQNIIIQWCFHPLALLPWQIAGIQDRLPPMDAENLMQQAQNITLQQVRLATREAIEVVCLARLTAGTPPRSQLERVVQTQLANATKRH